MSKNRVRQSYLILNLADCAEFFLNPPEIFAADAGRCGRWGGAQEGAYFAICELM